MKWQTAWQLVRDVMLTCTGLALIISQVGVRDPSSTLIVAGLALTVPAAASHAAGVLGGSPGEHGQPPSSPSAPPPPSSPSSSSSVPANGGGGNGGA